MHSKEEKGFKLPLSACGVLFQHYVSQKALLSPVFQRTDKRREQRRSALWESLRLFSLAHKDATFKISEKTEAFDIPIICRAALW